MSLYNFYNNDLEGPQCTCGSCLSGYISQRTITRIMFGALQAMHDLKREAERLEPGDVIDDPAMLCSYPFNWIPSLAQDPRREVLIGARSVLLVIYLILQDGGVPDTDAIRQICEKEPERLPNTMEYFRCGGSVMHILHELTFQVEADLRGEAYNVDSDDLIEALEQIPPCSTDDNLENWRRIVCLDL
ncbi:hypothetical protein GQ54DRAFT_296934 [Martensiomyces pterosporus]|nr:hypothetical protein GQ54DRAFT_296934 [Martensiomyces pterosporus]